MSVQILKKTENNCVDKGLGLDFEIGATPQNAMVLRKSLMRDVPLLGFEYVDIKENNTSYSSHVLIQRVLHLALVTSEANLLEIPESPHLIETQATAEAFSARYSPDKTFQFELKVSNDGIGQRQIVQIKANQFKMRGVTKYSDDGNFSVVGNEFYGDRIKIDILYGEGINFCELNAGQSVHIVAFAVKKRGSTGGVCFVPVRKNLVVENKSFLSVKSSELTSEEKNKLLACPKKNYNQIDSVIYSDKYSPCVHCNEMIRVLGAKKLSRQYMDDIFIFHVVSIGQRSPENIMNDAISFATENGLFPIKTCLQLLEDSDEE